MTQGSSIGPVLSSSSGGSGGAVTSVFGRTGAVTAANGDYTISQIGGLGTGVATFLGTPTSANLAAAVTDETGTGFLVFSASPALTGVPTAPTAAPGTSTTQIATTAFVAASPVSSTYTTSTITANPNPGVVGTYYRANYAASGNFTLPSSPATGAWIMVKQTANNTLTFVGTVDGATNYSITFLVSVLLIYNGTSWDVN